VSEHRAALPLAPLRRGQCRSPSRTSQHEHQRRNTRRPASSSWGSSQPTRRTCTPAAVPRRRAARSVPPRSTSTSSRRSVVPTTGLFEHSGGRLVVMGRRGHDRRRGRQAGLVQGHHTLRSLHGPELPLSEGPCRFGPMQHATNVGATTAAEVAAGWREGVHPLATLPGTCTTRRPSVPVRVPPPPRKPLVGGPFREIGEGLFRCPDSQMSAVCQHDGTRRVQT